MGSRSRPRQLARRDAAGRLDGAGDPEDRPVAFICLGGVRSGLVTQGFKAAGYDVYNVRGGFAAWVALGLPVEPEGGIAAPH